MKPLTRGMYARSLAGHDKGRLYIILETDDIYVYLCDGGLHPLDKPKKKKRKHIQPDYDIADAIRDKLEIQEPLRDEDIRKALKVKEEMYVEGRCN